MSINPCILCGKERIEGKTETEKIGNSFITYTDCYCSDPECQKKVDIILSREKAKRYYLKSESLKRENLRNKHIHLTRLNSKKSGL